MSKPGIDVAVLLEFFNRPSTFAKVFEQVKIARPTTLLLYQDGPREGRGDEEKIAECRRIAEDIDWPCTVYRKYQETNFGCDPSGFIAQSWAFTLVDKCIILEDDCVPCQSFFVFCKEMLDQYEHDERINIICGMNNTEVTKRISADYLFTIKGSIWGWATWRRVAETWDPDYTWLDDPKTVAGMKEFYHNDKEFDDIIRRTHDRRATGKAYFEYIVGPAAWRDRRLNIVPKYNMISNIGPDVGGTHCDAGVENMPKYARKLFYMKTYEYTLPLKEPKEVKRDLRFEREMTPGFFRTKFDNAAVKLKACRDILLTILRGETTLEKCVRHASLRWGFFATVYCGVMNAITSAGCVLFGNWRHGNKLQCGKARLTKVKVKNKGKNNVVSAGTVSELIGCRLTIEGDDNNIVSAERSVLSRMYITITGFNNTITVGSLSELVGCRLAILGNNNRIVIGENSHLMEGARDQFGCYISIGGDDNRIEIGDRCHLIDSEIFAEDKGNVVSIGDNCGIYNRSSLSVIEGTTLQIGSNGLLSSDVHIRTGDSHTLLDASGRRCNPSASITIGEHVWVGARAMFLKGSAVCRDSMVAANTLLTKPFTEPNLVIGGSPARVLKTGCNWKTERV